MSNLGMGKWKGLFLSRKLATTDWPTLCLGECFNSRKPKNTSGIFISIYISPWFSKAKTSQTAKKNTHLPSNPLHSSTISTRGPADLVGLNLTLTAPYDAAVLPHLLSSIFDVVDLWFRFKKQGNSKTVFKNNTMPFFGYQILKVVDLSWVLKTLVHSGYLEGLLFFASDLGKKNTETRTACKNKYAFPNRSRMWIDIMFMLL